MSALYDKHLRLAVQPKPVIDTLHDLLNAAEVLEEQRKSSLGVRDEWDRHMNRNMRAYWARQQIGRK